MTMTQNSPGSSTTRAYPATARLRAELLIARDPETLVAMFAEFLDEYGIPGHFCLRMTGIGLVPLLGDTPELVACERPSMIVDGFDSTGVGTRVVLERPAVALGDDQLAKVRGYAMLFAARATALQELADDVATDCGLTLRERYVLGRRLAGLAPIDIAIEAALSVETVGTLIDNAVDRLGAANLADATSFAARRGWLAVTNLQNCSSRSSKTTYNPIQGSG